MVTYVRNAVGLATFDYLYVQILTVVKQITHLCGLCLGRMSKQGGSIVKADQLAVFAKKCGPQFYRCIFM